MVIKKISRAHASQLALFVAFSAALQGGTLYWGQSASASWNTASNWFTDSDGTAVATAIPTSADDIIFSITSLNTTATAVTASTAIAAQSITFNSSAGSNFQSSGSTARTFDLGSGGITVDAAAGAVNLGNTGATISLRLSASQTWTNNSASQLRLVNAVAGPATGTSPMTLTLKNTGAGAMLFSNSLNNGAAGAALSLVIDSSGSGVTTLSGSGSTYSGGTTIKSGVLQISNASLGSGGLTLGDTTGSASARLNLQNSPSIATNITVAAGSSGSKSIVALTSAATPTLSGTISLSDNLNFGTTLTANTNPTITLTGVISGTGGITLNNSLVGSGTRTVTLTLGDGTNAVTNTYSGNTTLTNGALVLADNAALTFYIGANGVNNKVSGSGSNSATFAGDFVINTAGASLVDGNSWTLVDVGTLNESFAATFTVSGFDDAGGNLWTKDGFTFNEATGILSYSAVPEPSAFAFIGGLASLAALGFLRRRS